MKTIWTLALAASALTVTGEELALKARVQDTVERTFHRESTLSLEKMSMRMDGEEGPPPPGEMEREIKTEAHLTVRDVVLRTEDGRALSLQRSFSEVSRSRSMHMTDPMGGVHDQDTLEESELEGKTVVFELEGDETVTRWAEDGDGDDALLAGLVMSIDLESVLPAGSVEEGDTWDISTSLLATLARPAGELHLEPTEEPADTLGAPPEGFEPPDPEYGGEIEATFLGVREEGGRRLGAVELTIDALALVDLSAMADFETEVPDDAPPGMIMPAIESMDEERLYTGDGLLLWDLEAGRLLSLEINCDVRLTQTITMILELGDEEKTMEQVMVLNGTESWEVSFDE
jgi:hypothetical protein